jgi:nitrilase
VWLLGGSLPLVTDDPGRVTNTLLVFDPQGQRRARYDKMHLFRYDELTPGGRKQYDEGVVLRAGGTPEACDLMSRSGQALRVGLSICYDLRSPSSIAA